MKYCSVKNPANGKKSELHEQLADVFKDLQLAETAYAEVTGPTFKERFGDWEKAFKDGYPDGLENIGLVDPKNGEPVLKKNLANGMWYYTEADGITKDYLNMVSLAAFTAQQIEEVTDHLLFRFILDGGPSKSLNEYNPNELEKGRVMESIEQSIAAYKESIKDKPNRAELLEKIELVESNKEEYRKNLISYIESLGMKVRERVTDAQGNPVTEVSAEDKGGGLNMQDSFETNSKDTASVNTKIFLSQIENRVYGEVIDPETGKTLLKEDGTPDLQSIPLSNGYLETESFAKFDDVWDTLKSVLTDEVGYGYGENVVDIFDVMYNKLDNIKESKLWMHDLLDKLDRMRSDPNSRNKITQFVQAMTGTQVNFYVTQHDNGNYTVMNATSTNSKQSKVTNKWYNSFDARYLTEGVLKENERAQLEKEYDELVYLQEQYNEDIAKIGIKANTPLTEIQEEQRRIAVNYAALDLSTVYNKLGADEVRPKDFQTMFNLNGGDNKAIDILDDQYKRALYLFKTILDKDFKFKDAEGNQENIFNKEVSTKLLANAIGWDTGDMSEMSVLLTNGKTGYAVTNPTYVSNKINEWKKDPTELENLLLDKGKQNSRWINYLLAKDEPNRNKRKVKMQKRLDDFGHGLDSAFKSKGKNDGVSNVEITLNDQINANMVQMLNDKLGANEKSFFPTIIAADKSRRILFSGIKSFDSGIRKSPQGDIYISPSSINVAFGYFLDEYNRMKRVNRENNDPNIKKAIHYHARIVDGKVEDIGNGQRSQIFPQFDKDSKDPKYADLRRMLYGDSFKDDKFDKLSSSQEEIVKKHIKESIQERVQETADRLKGISGTSKALIKHYGINEGGLDPDYTTLAGDYFMNGLISSVEYTKMFSGDPAYYKNNADLIKRIPATYTDGLQLRIDSKDALIFNQATINGVEVASRYVDKILASVTDKSIALAYGKTVDEKGNPIGNNVNTTDAQAWITPRRWRFIKQKLGQWGPQHDKVYKKMREGKQLEPNEAKLAAQPLKGVYFEINEGRPVYLKYSQAVLIPSLVKGTPMQALYDKMTKDPETGKEYADNEAHLEIHEVVTLDGIKVGAIEPTTINKPGTTELADEFELNPQVLNNRGWKLQQDLPIKNMKETNVGSQIQKNIFEGMDMTGEYVVNGKTVDGTTLAQNMHDAVSRLSDLGKEKLIEDYGIDANGKITNKDKIYAALIREFKDRGGNDNIVTALEKGTPFDAMPQIRGKVESIFMSIMNRALTKITTQGGSFIQVSPFGFEKIDPKDSGIIVVSEDYNGEGLLPPRIVDGKVLPGQAMIPHSQAIKLLKKHGITLEGKTMKSAMSLLDPSVLELVTYRIPNQGMSSNDYLQIVGVLPQGVGDSILVYDGLPAKTGSDFDIDKLFVMQNNIVYDTETGKVTKLTRENSHLAVKTLGKRAYTDKKTGKKVPATPDIMYSSVEIEKMLVQNDLVANYKAVLNSPKNYDAMMRSIDGAQLKDDIVGTKKNGFKDGLFPAPVMKNMELFSPLVQLETKNAYLSGKMGVGQTANHLVDHVMNQSLNIEFNRWIGVGNVRYEKITTGKRKGQMKPITFFDRETTDKHSIADNLSAFLNAYVDIAKDPYISRANHNSITANTSFMLLRAGASMKFVNRFIGQPILRELVQLQMEQQSITASELTNIDEQGNKDPFKVAPMDAILSKYFGNRKIPSVVSGKTVADLSDSKLEANIKNRDAGSEMEFNVLKAWSMLQEQGKIFGEAVIAAKSDTAGAGGSNVDRMVNENKIKKIISTGEVVNFSEKYKDTMLGTYKENTLDWVKSVVKNSDLFLSGTQMAENVFNNISSLTANGEYLVDAKLGKSIDAGFYSYIMSGTKLFKDSFKKYNSITTNVPLSVEKKQEGIIAGTEERNHLIENLEIEIRKGKKYLGINNKDKPKHYQEQIYRGWMQLYNKFYKNEDGSINKDKIHPDRKLALDLARYSFIGSGFQNNLTQFFTHIPHQILKDNNLNKEIKDIIRNNNNENNLESDSEFVDQLLRHSIKDPKVIKSLKIKNMDGSATAFTYKPAKIKSQEFGNVQNNERIFPKFVAGRVGYDSFLYEMKGTVEKTDADGGTMRVPVYIRTFTLGTKEGKYNTVEYSRGTKISESNNNANNVLPSIQLKAQEYLDNIMINNKTFKDMNGNPLDSISIESINQIRKSNVEAVVENLDQIIEDNNIKCVL